VSYTTAPDVHDPVGLDTSGTVAPADEALPALIANGTLPSRCRGPMSTPPTFTPTHTSPSSKCAASSGWLASFVTRDTE
jgi:hypothetical protein